MRDGSNSRSSKHFLGGNSNRKGSRRLFVALACRMSPSSGDATRHAGRSLLTHSN